MRLVRLSEIVLLATYEPREIGDERINETQGNEERGNGNSGINREEVEELKTDAAGKDE